jgi:hypothetical protein
MNRAPHGMELVSKPNTSAWPERRAAIDGFDHADRFEGLFAGAAGLIVAAGRIHRFEDARRCLVARLELLEVADGDCGLRSAPRF